MKAIVCGGRDLKVTDGRIYGMIDLLKRLKPTEVVSGGASGGDQIGEIAARRLDIPVTVMRADWKTQGNAAGPIRNEAMATYAFDGICIVMPGGRGTADMERRAREHGMRIVKVVWEEPGATSQPEE